ncbi:methyltransferase [Lentimicrobium sp. L6]|uniref:class I SAM-dependent methyltransferase n=1 Tax=Lentimicrobium sp. L6 TaxID=2735916 RepID=UPI0015525D77|nr:methyltransferase domain-containing protein [Lentimicrobium sp. L6]NPD84961.1 methyltransferase [Lentimicrobium sp. L6]
MADYDKYYVTENLFGEPYVELIKFFKDYPVKGKLIDIGCGQGRDAIALAKLGYEVTGLDQSKLGIDQMNKISEREKLKLVGIVDDIYQFDQFQDFNIILFDSMFHFEKRDRKRETDLIIKAALKIEKGGVLCICIQDTCSKVKILKETIQNSNIDFEILKDSSLIYKYEDKASGHKSETKYLMYIIRKV